MIVDILADRGRLLLNETLFELLLLAAQYAEVGSILDDFIVHLQL